MLRAYDGMPSDDFISQLRTFVIALGLGPQVVDQVDKLTSFEEAEDALAAELVKAKDEDVKSGRTDMKTEILEAVTKWLEAQPNYDMIAAPCEALIAEIEKVEI